MFLPGFSVLMHYIEVLNNDVMCVVFDPGRAGICTLAFFLGLAFSTKCHPLISLTLLLSLNHPPLPHSIHLILPVSYSRTVSTSATFILPWMSTYFSLYLPKGAPEPKQPIIQIHPYPSILKIWKTCPARLPFSQDRSAKGQATRLRIRRVRE